MKLRILSEAADEANEATRWYRERNPDAATRFRQELRALWQRLRQNPEMYPVYEGEIRRALVPDFPYQVFFRVAEEVIEVLAISHSKRLPDHWRTRL